MRFKPVHILRHLAIALLLALPAVALSASDFTVIIDPGHGGTDVGAVGATINEKTINLKVARKLGQLIEDAMPDVKTVFTRSNDRFVTLQGRADIANNAQGDLFISIHTNSVDKKSPNRKTVAGASVYTLGFRKSEENLEVAMRENSVMKLEPDYSTVYEGFDPTSTESYIIFEMSRDIHMEQSIRAAKAVQSELVNTALRRDRGVRQANFWVLFKTSMPSMLVELDFICNPVQEEFLASEEGQDKLARAIFNGFRRYKESADKEKDAVAGRIPSKKTPKEDNPQKTEKAEKAKDSQKSEQETDDNRIIYRIQFLTSTKTLPQGSGLFKGLSPVDSYLDKGLVKYTYLSTESMEDATKELQSVRRLFPDAFIIKTRNGKRIDN